MKKTVVKAKRISLSRPVLSPDIIDIRIERKNIRKPMSKNFLLIFEKNKLRQKRIGDIKPK